MTVQYVIYFRLCEWWHVFYIIDHMVRGVRNYNVDAMLMQVVRIPDAFTRRCHAVWLCHCVQWQQMAHRRGSEAWWLRLPCFALSAFPAVVLWLVSSYLDSVPTISWSLISLWRRGRMHYMECWLVPLVVHLDCRCRFTCEMMKCVFIVHKLFGIGYVDSRNSVKWLVV